MQGAIVRKVLKNGEPRYHCVVRIGDKQVWRFGGSTRKEAERLLSEWVADVNNGTYAKPKKIMFRDFAEEWLQNYAFGVVKESTYRSYHNVIKNHVIPQLGHYPLQLITTRVVQQFIVHILKIGKTHKTANNLLVLLKTMFRVASEWSYTRTNSASSIKPFRVDQKEMDFLQPHEVQLLMKYADEPFRTIFVTAAFTGMRRGEVLALQWGDCDFRSNRIFVRRSLYWLCNDEMEQRKDKKRWRFVSPKTERSRRTIVMSPTLKKALEIHRINSPVSEQDLVFCNTRGNPLDPDNLVKREFHATLDRAGLRRIRFHDLRHTYTSILISAGFNPKFIQSQVGHASIQTTIDRYGHLFPIDYAGAGAKIDEQVFNVVKTNASECKAVESA